jgi:hypothetical protein
MKKSFIITSMAAFAALCFSLTAQAQGPVVVSDQDDYSPGQTALFQAAGFQSNELLDFSVAVQGDDGTWVPDIAWADIPADGSGGAEVDYVVPDTWANQTLQLTVMGLTSGFIATTTFTDTVGGNPVNNVNFRAGAAGGGPGLPLTTITVNGTNTNPAGNPATFAVSFVDAGVGSTDVGTKPDTNLTFSGYPTTLAATGGHYALAGFQLEPGGTSDGTLHDLDVLNGAGQYTTGASANTGMGGVHSTIVGVYTWVADVPNHAPVITPQSDVEVDLGQIVGCLDGNGGFGTSVDVEYSVSQVDTNNFNVNATFNGGNQTLIATVFDADGNLSSSGITLSPGSQALTFTGAGSSTQAFSTSVTATDSLGASDGPTTCPTIGNVTAQIIYDFTGFFSPLSNVATTKVKRGSGVPVKFQVFDCDGVTPITTGDFTIRVTKLNGITPPGLDVDDAGFSGDDGINFRYDPTGMQWIFNLKTNSTYDVGCTYLIWANLGDGVDHNVAISIK